MIQEKINYSHAIYECILTKKKMIGKSIRYFHVFEDMIVINKDSNNAQAVRLFHYEDIQKVKWNYDINSKTYRTFLKSFELFTKKESIKYYGDQDVLIALKQILAKFITQVNVKDDYECKNALGEGSYAVVFLFKQLSTQCNFAGKCIEKKKLQKIEKGFQAVANEIHIMRLLSPHSQIVNLHEVYEGDTTIYLILDLCQGHNLQAELQTRNTLLDQDQVKTIMQNLLKAVEYMHSKNIMHRDLKPENILFQCPLDYNTLKIGDFGLAAISDEIPYIYPKCGTPGYVAPEVANLTDKSKEYSTICDIFSCGAIFHLLLTGQGLFKGSGHIELLKLNKECHIDPDDDKYNNLTLAAKDLLFKMLKTNPLHRPDAHELLKHQYFLDQPLQQMQQFSMNMIPIDEDTTLVTKEESHLLNSPVSRNLKQRFSFLQLSNKPHEKRFENS